MRIERGVTEFKPPYETPQILLSKAMEALGRAGNIIWQCRDTSKENEVQILIIPEGVEKDFEPPNNTRKLMWSKPPKNGAKGDLLAFIVKLH